MAIFKSENTAGLDSISRNIEEFAERLSTLASLNVGDDGFRKQLSTSSKRLRSKARKLGDTRRECGETRAAGDVELAQFENLGLKAESVLSAQSDSDVVLDELMSNLLALRESASRTLEELTLQTSVRGAAQECIHALDEVQAELTSNRSPSR